MNKDNDIDDLFSDKMESEIKRKIKKKRSRLNLILVIISVVSTLIIISIGIKVFDYKSANYIEKAECQEKEALYLEYSIMHPNEYIGKVTQREIGYFAYESTYDIGRRIGGKSIFAGSVTNSSNGLYKRGGHSWGMDIPRNPSLYEDIGKRYSDVYGLRELSFLHPYVQYTEKIRDFRVDENKTTEGNLLTDKETIINDFHCLNEIDNNKIVEMVLIFDKEYTYDQVNSMLNSNLITFYWVDSNSEKTKQQLIEAKLPEWGSIIGIKAIDDMGEFVNDVNERMVNFKETVKRVKEIKNTIYGDFCEPDSIENIDEDNIKINGVVVVGSTKELKAIQDKPIIKHAILGTVVDKY